MENQLIRSLRKQIWTNYLAGNLFTPVIKRKPTVDTAGFFLCMIKTLKFSGILCSKLYCHKQA